MDDFSGGDKVLIETLYKSFKNEQDLRIVNMAKSNNLEMFENNWFKVIFQDKVLEKYTENEPAFGKLVGADEGYYNTVYSLLTKDLYKWF